MTKTIFQDLHHDVVCYIAKLLGKECHAMRLISLSTRDALSSPERFAELLIDCHGYHALIRAVGAGREDLTKVIMDLLPSSSGRSVDDFHETYGCTPKELAIFKAVKYGHVGLVRLILDCPTPPDVKSIIERAVHIAVIHGHADIIHFLAERSDVALIHTIDILKSNKTFVTAAEKGFTEIIQIAQDWWTKDSKDKTNNTEEHWCDPYEYDPYWWLDREGTINAAIIAAKNAKHVELSLLLQKWL